MCFSFFPLFVLLCFTYKKGSDSYIACKNHLNTVKNQFDFIFFYDGLQITTLLSGLKLSTMLLSY